MRNHLAISNSDRYAFTLVELLVVIGIIALLISILLPALSKARASAQRLVCLSNMRQVGMAVQQYTIDNNGAFPSLLPRGDVPGSDYWLLMIPPYLASGQMIHDWNSAARIAHFGNCPTMAATYSAMGLNPNSWQFAMNWTLGPSNNVPYWRKISRLKTPTDTIVLSEAGYNASGPIWWQLDDYYMRVAANYTKGVHGQYSNIFWADGHAGAWENVDLLGAYPYRSGDPQDKWSAGFKPWAP